MAKFLILGMKGSKGVMDNGRSFDSCTVFVQTRLDESKGTAKGFAVGEYKFGEASTFDKYKHLPFPFYAEVETDVVTSGKVMAQVIVSLTPLKPEQAKPEQHKAA
jgi:hypothetical protein